MKRILVFILLAICLFGTVDLNAQIFNSREPLYVSESTMKMVKSKINQRIHIAELRYVLSKSTENNQSGHSTVKQLKDSSYIRLISGVQWLLSEVPQKPLFFQIRHLLNSKNVDVVNYYHFVVFCNYCRKNGDLNYDEIDYISMDKEFMMDSGERFPMKYKICFSSDGKPTVY